MPKLPNIINGVGIQKADTVNDEVSQSLIDGLSWCISTGMVVPGTLKSIWISSASDQHKMPSRHAQHKAVDISRVNGTKIAVGYPIDPFVRAIVDAIQDNFEGYVHKRENFGPHLKRKHGQPWNVSGHDDHIHLSVN